MSHDFKATDAKTDINIADAGDVHLNNARSEIASGLGTEPLNAMRSDTAKQHLPTAQIGQDTINFGPTATDRENNAGEGNDSSMVHKAGDGHNHANLIQSNPTSETFDGDTTRLYEQARMSQEVSRLGLGTRDINLVQQLEDSVPHSSPKDLALRLKAARERGGILDLSRPS